ncbi:hypothetical protein DRN98_10010, partial [Methanosarcinales archaeon]
VVERKLERLLKRQKDILAENFTQTEMEHIPKSYDIIGDIAIIEMPDELKGRDREVAEYIMRTNKTIKVVAKKIGIHHGVYRTQDLKVILGENRKETIHKENNVLIKLNVETCYFSPRLSHERKRISQLVKNGEEILVMFSGVAPYPLVISKNSNPKNVYGVELNPEAHIYAAENARNNKLMNVNLIHGDVRKVCSDFYKYIIGLKSSIDPGELKERLKVNPQLIEFHLFEEDLYENKANLEKSIEYLQSKGIRVMLHMPFTFKGKKFTLAVKDVAGPISMLRILGKICKKYKIGAVVHPSEFVEGVKEEKQLLIENLMKLEDYYDFFYFENVTNCIYSTTGAVYEISKKSGIKNVCIDLAHLFGVYKDNNKIINHIKKLSKHFNTYFHVNDCDGVTHSTEIGKGKIDFERVLPCINFGVAEIVSKDEFNPKEMIRSYKRLSKIKAEPKKFDRIIMPLPKSAEDFLESAKNVSSKGTVIHFYDFAHENELPESSVAKIKRHFPNARIMRWVKCGQYAPGKWRICVDFEVR